MSGLPDVAFTLTDVLGLLAAPGVRKTTDCPNRSPMPDMCGIAPQHRAQRSRDFGVLW